MKFSPFIFTVLVATLVGCQRPVFQDSTSFVSNTQRLSADLRQQLAPLSQRAESGIVQLSLSGGQLSHADRKQLISELSEYLLLPVSLLEYQASEQQTITVEVVASLEANTCRYSKSKIAVTENACLQLRNQYVSLVNKSTWKQGEGYQEANSALTTGAVQRLLNNQLKVAEKQSVSGE